MEWWGERELTAIRIGLSPDTFWQITYAEYLQYLKAHRENETARSVRDLNRAMYIAGMSGSKASAFYTGEMKRLIGSNEPTLTVAEMKANHEALVEKLGKTIVRQ